MTTIDTTKPVLVTGATGYIASWIVKILLERGYTVRATVRNKNKTEKYIHLTEIADNSPGKLEIIEADLLTPGAFDEAVKGCELVMHTASPFVIARITDPAKQLIEPALEGTRNVLNAVNKTDSVKRVVLTSSVVAIHSDAIDIRLTPEGIFKEDQWNTTATIKSQPYPLSKTLAEKEAWEIMKKQSKWDLVVINPGFVMGPSLTKRTDSTSIDFMRSLAKGQFKSGAPDLYFGIVDVRDVAMAHILAGTRPQASGRHITVSDSINVLTMGKILQSAFPDKKFGLPKTTAPKFLMYLVGPMMGVKWSFVNQNIGIPVKYDNSYSKSDLGLSYRPVEETLTDHLQQLINDNLV